MTRSYADLCLERAEKATEGPWNLETAGTEQRGQHAISSNEWVLLEYNWDIRPGKKPEPCEVDFGLVDLEFIAHARTDVPELARRLKKAITVLYGASTVLAEMNNKDWAYRLQTFAEALEALPEEK